STSSTPAFRRSLSRLASHGGFMFTRRQFFSNALMTLVGTGVSGFLLKQSLYASGKGTVKIIEFNDSGKKIGPAEIQKVHKTDEEWQKQLSPLQFQVTRKEGTERAFTGEYFNLHDKGLYRCICCGNALFDSATKFESGTGWPSFWAPIAKENVRTAN